MKIKLDMDSMTLGDLIAADELLPPDKNIMDVLTARDPRGFVALACVVHQREDPTFTWEQATKLRMSDLEVVSAPDAAEVGEAPGGNNGIAPVLSPVSGG